MFYHESFPLLSSIIEDNLQHSQTHTSERKRILVHGAMTLKVGSSIKSRLMLLSREKGGERVKDAQA